MSNAYVATVLLVILGASAYSLRAYGIFRCQAAGYGQDGFLGYCGATGYGDYDHGAFWFELEPRAVEAARRAKVLFLGNSRMQFGFSTSATTSRFESIGVPYFLLGFSHYENFRFEAPLLRKLQPEAAAYVINIDLFFESSMSAPAQAVMREGGTKSRYQNKQAWQQLHKRVCSLVPALCGGGVAYFRSPATGAWVVTDPWVRPAPVSYDPSVDQGIVQRYAALGREFLPLLNTGKDCVLLTMVPTVKTNMGTAKAIAAALELPLVAPELDGLTTFDESHLDGPSAERWSTAFFEAASPRLEKCARSPQTP
jgi:hypothetical protein